MQRYASSLKRPTKAQVAGLECRFGCDAVPLSPSIWIDNALQITLSSIPLRTVQREDDRLYFTESVARVVLKSLVPNLGFPKSL